MKKLDFLPNLKNRYSIRRFSVGTASILIGSLLFLGHNGEAKAAENTNDTTVAEATKASSTAQPTAAAATLQESTAPATETNADKTAPSALELAKTQALKQLETYKHLPETQVHQFTEAIQQAKTEADVQTVVEHAKTAEDEAVQKEEQAKAEAAKKAAADTASTKTQSASKTTETTSNTETAKTPASETVSPSETTPAPSVAVEQTTPTVEAAALSVEQKVEKVRTALAADYDNTQIDEVLSVIDVSNLTDEQIKAEALRILLGRASEEKDFYSPQATLPRTEEAEQKTAVRAFSVDTTKKDEVVVTPENFNDYFWTVDDATYDKSTGIATLTPNERSKKGSISLDTKMNINKDFHFSGEVNLGDKGEGHPKDGAEGGDGIAFIFNPGNTHELGLYGSAVGMGGLKYAFGFKLDTYVNKSYDPKGKSNPDPIKFYNKGSFGAFAWSNSSGIVSTQSGNAGWDATMLNPQPADNQFQTFTIDYDGDTKDMTITYAGQTWKQNMSSYFRYTHKNEYALSIAASTGGAYNLQQVKINQFTYTAGALLEEDFIDADTHELFDRPIRTSGDVDKIITVQDHSAYLAEKGYKLLTEDDTLAPTYDKAKHTVKLTNESQFILYHVKDIQAPVIGDIADQSVGTNTEMTPLVLDITDNSKYLASKTVTGLPDGVTFNSDTNTISGTPTAAGTSTVTVTATGHAGLTTTKTFTYTVTDTQAPTITQVSNQTAEAYNTIAPITIAAQDNAQTAPTITVTGLPAGLTYNPTTHQITGKPTATGTSTVTVTATDAANNTSTSTFDFTVQPNRALEALRTAVADAKTVNKADYTPNSVAALDAKVTEGEALLAHPENGSTEQFNTKAQEVTQAKSQLVQRADKTALKKAIADAEKITNLDPTKAIDQQLKTALANAKTVDADLNATQKATDDSKNSLINAIQEKLRADAYEKLQEAVARGVQVASTNGYTPNSIQAVKDMIQKVNPLVTASMSDDPAVRKQFTVAQIEQATKDINDSISGLVRQADKTELQKAIDKAGTLGTLNPSDKEDKAVQDKLAAANQVKADGNATQQQVTDATTALNDAINKKLYQDALDTLNAAIRDAKAVTKSNYTPQTVAPFEAAITAGETKAADTHATPEQLKAAAKAIKDAQNQLQPVSDKAALKAAIKKAEALPGLNPADKEDKAVQDALAAAKTVDGNANATPAEVASATKALNDAIAAKERQDALDELQKALDAAKAINKNDYKPSTVTPFEAAITAGEAAKADATKTPEELKAAAQAIKDAQNALQAKADKAGLESSIATAEGLGQLNPADAEDKAVQDALAKAKEVQADPNASQEAVDAAKAALDEAINAKKVADAKDAADAAALKQAALDALKAELAKVAQINKDNFTPNTVSPLTEKEDAGKAIVAAPDAKTVEEIQAATQALKDAEAGLVAKADKTELKAAIYKAEALPGLNPADKEDKAVQDALAAAKTVDGNANATPAEVAAATKALNDAIAAKERQDALDELQKALDAAKAINKNDYKPSTVTPFEAAITAGEAAKADATKTPEELKAAAQAIKDAQNALQAKADKAGLESSIATAEGLGQLNPADAEDKAVQDALAKAKEVQADPNASQEAVDAAKAALDEAINAKKVADAKDAADAAALKQAALDALKAELAKVDQLDKNAYTPNSVQPLNTTETAGQSIVDDPANKTVEEIQAATQALKDAEAGLVAKANKDALNTAITAAEGLTLNPSDAEDKAVQDALAKAKAVQADPNASQAEVDAAKDALNKAIEAKTAQDKADAINAALDALKAELAKVAQLDKDAYTPNSVQPLNTAETAGKAIVAAPEAKTVEEIQAATQALKDAEAGLVAKADKAGLEGSIATAEGLGQLNPADAEDKAVQDALAKAKEVQADPNASQEAVDAAKAALDEAINAKKVADAKDAADAAALKQAALDALKAELAKVAQLDKNAYTPNSVTPLNTKESEGQSIVDAPDAKTVEEIQAATQELKDAEAGLVAKADKAELQAAIDKANALGDLNPADAEDKAVQDAVAAGEVVKADGNATPQQVAEATKAINDAIAAKERQDALDELQKALDTAKAINKNDYKPSTVSPFEAAITAGEAAKADATKTPEELKAAAQAIKDAQNALQAKADKAGLESSIATAEGLGQLNPADAEDKAVQDALAKAKEVQADPNASQEAVDAAKAALDEAMNAKKVADAKDAADAAALKQAALDALKAELAKVAQLDKDAYTPNSVQPLNTSETAGKAIVAAPEAKTVEEIQAATQALKDAEVGLVAKANKDALNTAITAAEGLTLNPSDAEDKAVQDALAKAKEVQADPNATQAEVDAAKDALNKAIEAKTAQDKADAINAALDALKAELAKVAQLDKNAYTPNSVQPLNTSETAGKAIVAAPEAKTVEEIQAATQALKDAEAGLVAKANKDALNTAITAAEGLTLNPSDAEDKAVQDALAKAKSVQADPNATQAEVDAAKDALNKAIEAKTAQDKADAINAALDALKAELEKVDRLDRDAYTPDSVLPLDDAEEAGYAVVEASESKTVEEIEAATQALKDAEAGLVEQANKHVLETLIDYAECLELDPTDAEDKAVLAALATAETVDADPNAVQAAVDGATYALDKAIEAKDAQDKADVLAELEKAIEEAQTIEPSNCPEETAEVLDNQVKVGQTIIEQPNHQPIQTIEEAAKDICDTLEVLGSKAPDNTKVTVPTKDNTTVGKETKDNTGEVNPTIVENTTSQVKSNDDQTHLKDPQQPKDSQTTVETELNTKSKVNTETNVNAETKANDTVKADVKAKATSKATTKAGSKSAPKAGKAKVLPNIGENTSNSGALFGGLFAALESVLLFRKRKNEDKDHTEK
ncbi:FIVAR domain-containing protein [Staphylococcus simulans]|uniref:lectin-like domain-containing protein n=1 Tax=Staphylococcus simulans TaxID=1286 RepID=UPI0022B579B6|nr:putative Ig domain-containing protein [Staphylococcus simulans]MCD8914328.1 FIVAR domain-containing protein [Staphylococcus simulans]